MFQSYAICGTLQTQSYMLVHTIKKQMPPKVSKREIGMWLFYIRMLQGRKLRDRIFGVSSCSWLVCFLSSELTVSLLPTNKWNNIIIYMFVEELSLCANSIC